MPQSAVRKVAILGGGAGAISTALYLTNPENPQKFDVTIYQMGWRLGGQGASGRNMEKGGRIEEHGLHLWGGFYENAFAMMRRVYQDAARPAGSPLSVVFDTANPDSTIAAFKPFSDVIFGDYDQHWSLWKIRFPENELLPGDNGTSLPDMRDLISEILTLLWQQIENALDGNDPLKPDSAVVRTIRSFIDSMNPGSSSANIVPGSGAMSAGSRSFASDLIRDGFEAASSVWNMFHPQDPRHRAEAVPLLLKGFDMIAQWVWAELSAATPGSFRHLWQLVDLSLAAVRGLIEENVPENGFEPLDVYDLREWLTKSGANPMSLDSVLVRGFYDYFFSLENGDPNKPRLSAGSAILHMIRLVYTYRGSIFWKMQAGMGDTIFAPAYEALRKRGVKFKFFHRVMSLTLTPDGKSVASVQMSRQADLKPDVAEYDPFVQVKDLACWPNQPNWDQLVNGDAMKSNRVNMENPWGSWEGVGSVEIQQGTDFDLAVIAISKDALYHATPDLMKASPAWNDMVTGIATVDTIAAQLWFTEDSAALGWTDPPAVLTGYQRPHSTWCEMSHLLPREDWPEDGPKAIAYLCGPIWRPNDAQNPYFVPVDDEDYEEVNANKGQVLTREWILAMMGKLYAKAALPVNPSGIDFKYLYYPKNDRDDLGRLDWSYIRMNVTPQERYVLTLPGTHTVRMREGRTPFDNLYIAGDTVYTLLGGCVEAAVMSGMLVSRTLTGYPEEIPGYLVKKTAASATA
jgi:uncharacterized protein with NAD-binding domain and iron-sulfur cluster